MTTLRSLSLRGERGHGTLTCANIEMLPPDKSILYIIQSVVLPSSPVIIMSPWRMRGQFQALVMQAAQRWRNSNAGKRTVAQAKQSLDDFRSKARASYMSMRGEAVHLGYFRAMQRQVTNSWYRRRGGILAFLAANFVTLLCVLQGLGPLLGLMHERKSSPPHAPKERREGRDSSQSTHNQPPQDPASAAPERSFPASTAGDAWAPATQASAFPSFTSSVLDETNGAPPAPPNECAQWQTVGGGSDGVSFETSFLVKMGEETEFTSSLTRERLTGNVTSH